MSCRCFWQIRFFINAKVRSTCFDKNVLEKKEDSPIETLPINTAVCFSSLDRVSITYTQSYTVNRHRTINKSKIPRFN